MGAIAGLAGGGGAPPSPKLKDGLQNAPQITVLNNSRMSTMFGRKAYMEELTRQEKGLKHNHGALMATAEKFNFIPQHRY